MTQHQVLIKLMLTDWVDPIKAFKEAGTLKLSVRANELKEDFSIHVRRKTGKNRFGNNVYWHEYKIVKPSKKALAKYGL